MVRIFDLLISCTFILFLLTDCTSGKKDILEVNYLREGKIYVDTVPLTIINSEGNIVSANIDTIRFSTLDSVSFTDGNPDRMEIHTTPVPLDFSKDIQPYSPEYYTLYTVYNIDKAIAYYNRLFDNKIDFDSQKKYKDLEITFGNMPYQTTPRAYILEKGSNPSPSLFFHEIGHRAFWLIQDSLNVKFGSLTYIHMGLLEYFTVSLNNSPVIGEDALPAKIIRNAAWTYGYPPADSLNMDGLMRLMKESYEQDLQDPQSNFSKVYEANMSSMKDHMHIIDNHRGGMIITSTLWRIRQQLGHELTDKLVAKSILDFNDSMAKRNSYYTPLENEIVPQRIEWYDLVYTLIQKDKEMNNGKAQNIILEEFQKTGFDIARLKLDV